MGLLAGRVVLGVVFGLAAAAKLADRVGARRALVDFGIPERFATPGAVLLPLAELGVAGALLVGPGARPGAAGALALLVVFSVAVALNLAAGREMDCHCFGQLHSSPIGAATLVRNGLLGVLSMLVAVEGPGLGVGDALAQIGGRSTAAQLGLAGGLALTAVAAVVGWLFLAAVRQQGRLLLRPSVLKRSFEGPGRPARAPGFRLASVTGESVALEDLVGRARPVLLVFTAADCRPCVSFLPEVGRWQRDHADALTVVVLAQGDAAVNQARAVKERIATMLFDPDGAVGSAYGADGTPGAVLVGADGALRGLVASGADQIRVLVLREVAAHHRHVHHAPKATDATPLSRRRALALLAMTVVGAALSLRPAKATACGAECRSSSDCPGTCTNCKKRPGYVFGHCH